MNDTQQKELGKVLWGVADKLRGAMNADDFRDYMLSFLFLRYLSDNYEQAVEKELGSDYTQCEEEIENAVVNEKQEDIINSLKKQIADYFGKQNLDVKALEAIIEEHEELLESKKLTPLIVWYVKNLDQVANFEKQMRRKVHFVIKTSLDLIEEDIIKAKSNHNQFLKELGLPEIL